MEHWWLVERLSDLFARHLTNNAQGLFLAEFNRKNSKYRMILADVVLGKRRDLTTDDFSDDAISYLLGEFPRKKRAFSLYDELLGITATETFATGQILEQESHFRCHD
jgi:hypothetical protein